MLTAKEFKKLRKSLGLTQRQMVVALNIKNVRSVQRYESGEYPVQGSVLRVCEYIKEYGLLDDKRFF